LAAASASSRIEAHVDNLFVDSLSKSFILGRAPEEQPFRMRQIVNTARRWVGRGPADDAPKGRREFWALKDVSFRVQPGTVLGIIGANGAGKSTLLKIIARVLTPTGGRVVGVGRCISLLELGAGFDPDLSARDNIIMNAAMNGVPKSEVMRRFDAIMEFAETGEFLDTALKHYSSGMYLRLAFSCAINMDPQILLADEILAVGDVAFQERCLQRVKDEAARGLTVLFVSHDMEAITRVCARVIWLNRGAVFRDGDPEEVVDEYQNAIWETADLATAERGRHVNRFGRILSVALVAESGNEIGAAPTDQRCAVRIRVETFIKETITQCAMDLYAGNVWLLRARADKSRRVDPGLYDVYFRIPSDFLAQTTYTVSVSLTLRRKNDERDYPLVMYKALKFMAYTGEGTVERTSKRTALLAPRLNWDIEPFAVRTEADSGQASDGNTSDAAADTTLAADPATKAQP
jgi:lipopolysaccharide transport system ATP-binding protein